MDTINYKKFYEDLREILKCAVCLGFLRTPVITCVSGHGICSSCKKQLVQCPTCRSTFSNNKAIVISQIMDVMPIACSNTGCVVVTQGVDDHSKFCGFRRTVCLYCNKSLPVNMLKEHYRKHHSKKRIFVEGTSAGNWRWNSSFSSALSLFDYYDNFFWRKMSIDRDKSLFKITFAHVPNRKTGRNFYADILFENTPLKSSSCTEIALLDDNMNIDNIKPNFIMPVEDVANYSNNGLITYVKMTIKSF